MLKIGSGSLRRRIDEIFGETLTDCERQNLATLIAYPEQKLLLILQTTTEEDAWYCETLRRLVQVCRSVISKYPCSQVQAALPEPLADVSSPTPGPTG